MIEVRLFASFRAGREKIILLDASIYKTASDILFSLDIPEDEVAILLINGRHSKAYDTVKDGDIVALFPPVGGG
ncbi:MAG: MoaD/ThiS family protein [Eubacteriaceae bacterium]|jgi:molybdopterin converting factor small subunit|nr:MoaD/ThiS family protein [Eubacteriaceae bacterium]